jgi:large subunit ribosomal protein L10
MKKIGIIFKETSENRIKNSLKSSNGVFILRYSGLSSPDITWLRQALKGLGSSFFVVKNTVARRAFKTAGLESLVKSIEGPCGLVFVNEEPVGASKVLCNFSKGHEQLRLEGGILKDKILEKKDIEFMSRLPSLEVLRAQAVGALKSPINGIVFVLKGNLRKLVYCLEEIKKKRETK